MATPKFLDLLCSAGLLSYQAQLLDNGFDGVEALRDITNDDIIKLCITASDRVSFDRLIAQVRSIPSTAPRPAVDSTMGPGVDHAIVTPTETEPGRGLLINQANNHGAEEKSLSPLGSEMLVHISTWTRITTNHVVAQRLLALYFCWEYPIFASLSKPHFTNDFCKGQTRFCSPILVNALLALGYCYSSQQTSTVDTQDQFYPSGDLFFEESQRLLHTDENHHNLTTIQALGIMSIRELSCGRDSRSYHYAGECLRLAIEMGLQHIDESMDSDQSAVMKATLWGAFGLQNAWALTSCSLPACSSTFTTVMPSKPTVSADIESAPWVLYTDDNSVFRERSHKASHMCSVYIHFCDLSELIHESLYIQFPQQRPMSSKELLDMYLKYISWYNALPEFLRLDHNSTPAVLFAHMYYHFAVLLLFRPFITHSIIDSNTSPRNICFEAANSISALLQSYSELYTLQRIPSFVPHLILTSSVMHLYIRPSISNSPNLVRPQLRLDTRITGDINQILHCLLKIAPSHRTAKRAHFLLGALAKREHFTVNIPTLPDAEDWILLRTNDPDTALDVLEDKYLSNGLKIAGRFIGILRDLQSVRKSVNIQSLSIETNDDELSFPSDGV